MFPGGQSRIRDADLHRLTERRTAFCMNPDVLIVGGGIGGTMLAALLSRGGKRVLIIERAKGPPAFLRPEILWPQAVDTLFSLESREFWERECVRAAGGIVLDNSGKLTPVVTPELFGRAGVLPFFENPNATRETLLGICGAEVRRGIEVLAVLRDGARVRGVRARDLATGAEMEIEAAITIGDDGAESRVRAGCGIAMELRAFPMEFITRGVSWPSAWPVDVVRIFLPRRRLPGGMLALAVFPLRGGKAACLSPVVTGSVDEALAADFAELLAGAAEVPEELRAVDFPRSFTRIGRKWGHAPRYGCDGAVLLGDAIHPVSPAGGQGANMAIADAVALARILLAGAPDPAAALERERRAANERGVQPTRLTSRFFRLSRIPLLGSLPGLLIPLVLRSDAMRIRALRRLAGWQENAAWCLPRLTV